MPFYFFHMKYILKKYHLNTPEKKLINDIKKTASSLGKRTLGRLEYKHEGSFSESTICRRFGSWNKALVLAGLYVQKHSYISKEELMRNMKKVWDSLGRQPVYKDMCYPLSGYGGSTYIKKFGSWQKSLEAFVVKQAGGIKYKRDYKARLYKSKRKHKSRLNINLSLRYNILKRDNFKCRLCGASPAIKRGVTLHIDHIIPRSAGGETISENLQTLCSDCNYGKGAK